MSIFQVGWSPKNIMKVNSKVLALKYRPQTFEELIGQQLAAETISNAIKSNKSANAYLFTGIRGVGKTTFARIVAKSLNCINSPEKLCKENFCENCLSIIESNHIDVLEMDAASKTGVDDVRDLIEFSRYGPTSGKYKIFIIDEVHMLSKQAFNALLKTLEEPPEYLKFIFATTEIKKIPVTVVSRCQRFDLSRIKSNELYNYLKQILIKENAKASDDALKLIVKLSEGSVRDALSLLDRGLIAASDDKELTLKKARDIFGYFDKGFIIEILDYIFQGEEKRVLECYRNLFDSGIEPKIFLNDFLEVLYYIKNISSIKLDSSNFSLNDVDFEKILSMSKKLEKSELLLFWQFTIQVIEEINLVSNQNLSVEMFLIRLLYLKGFRSNYEGISHKNISNLDNDTNQINQTINQIKNISQEEKPQPKIKNNETVNKLEIKNFDQLIEICNSKKELKLKYELENNVNLVSFSNGQIEISFNENLEKDFIKNLSLKLYQWTNQRWIISLSKKDGLITKKEQKNKSLESLSAEVKKSKTHQDILKLFPDAELVEIKKND